MDKLAVEGQFSSLFTPVSGFSLSNGVQKLTFDANNHLYSWSSVAGSAHRVNHSYVQYRERKGILEVTVCDGSNVYTFVPDQGRYVLTPEVNG